MIVYAAIALNPAFVLSKREHFTNAAAHRRKPKKRCPDAGGRLPGGTQIKPGSENNHNTSDYENRRAFGEFDLSLFAVNLQCAPKDGQKCNEIQRRKRRIHSLTVLNCAALGSNCQPETAGRQQPARSGK